MPSGFGGKLLLYLNGRESEDEETQFYCSRGQWISVEFGWDEQLVHTMHFAWNEIQLTFRQPSGFNLYSDQVLF